MQWHWPRTGGGSTIDDDARRAGTTLGMDVDGDHPGRHGADSDWSWPPYVHDDPAHPRFVLDEWAPASVVRRPWVRVGRWTLLYRRP